ncbi:serine/arginine repetitive matrix protein 1 isoform X2 [Drosophila rhopaloa]|uniref:Serine/arginine repetitive matrix protein 1 isoform X2 n=1 Tax=Drosophila rhopaloa TaxID=1041015 RepID=A0A6P4FLS9_DRORH|nr:serine/arginine repetitive matrix protein 1 isoform X2 [Drosophila rhopaloa]
MAYSVGLPAQLIKKNYLIIENPTNGRSTCTETIDAHIDNNVISFDQKRGSKLHRSSSFSVFGSTFVGLTLVPERRRRVSGGNGKYHQQSNLLRNPLVVRSGEIPDQDECAPSCPYRNYQNQNNQQQDTNQYNSQDYQRTGTAPCQTGYYDNSPPQQYYAPQGYQGYVPQGRTQAHSKDRSASDCGCDPSPGKRAYRTPSSHYMEYREFQHSPKKNPALDRPQYEEYPAESHRSNRLERKASECSCDSDSLPGRQPVQRTNRLQRKTSICCCESDSPPGRQLVQRTNRLERKESECCCLPESSPGKRVQRKNQTDKNYYQRKPTPSAQTCPIRCHARSHIQATPPPPAPKRKCLAATSPPPTCRKPAPRSRSMNSTKRGSKRRCSACDERDSYRYSDGEPTDYVERSHSATEVLRNPLVQSRSSCDGLPQASYSPECVQQKPRSCRKPKAEKRSSSRRGPPICSNETLMEKPVKSYRFNCPENGRCASCRKLCPKCNKIKAQSKKSALVKRCVTSVAQKCCPTCGLLPMMPNISIPDVTSSNRIIYKTLGRCRPRKVPKTRYELTICCKKRCQGGRNSHYMTGTIATSLKRRAKAVIPGGTQVAPSRSYRQGQNVTSPIHTRSQSRAGHSYVSQERSSQPGQHRERSAAPQHFQMRSPPENLVQKSERRQSERESNPASLSQQRTRALSPIISIWSSYLQ